ncbi:MAG: hypothetical protein R3E97_18905 [Candidatus Eisenbacteria bacterium]
MLTPRANAYDLRILVSVLTAGAVRRLLFSIVTAFILHRWGMVVGIRWRRARRLSLPSTSDAVLLSRFYAMRGWDVLLGHMLGALAGGIYEARGRGV